MNKTLELVKINSNYCDYLRKYDEKVPYNKNTKELRPFVGILFVVHDCEYFAPLSSPKPKHIQIKNNLDFYKINNGIFGVVNFNNMIPVNKRLLWNNKFKWKSKNNQRNWIYRTLKKST